MVTLTDPLISDLVNKTVKGGERMISEEIKSEFAAVGLDVPLMVERFMDSEDMFIKFLHKFFEAADGVVAELSAAVSGEDNDQLFKSAHALKGLAGNIGLDGVYIPACKIVDSIRDGEYDSCGDDARELEQAYYAAAAIAKKL